ncbi:MFS transporter [Thalassospiraceae bacterium LMO-JJ14]|nr:MFS transporter [Thalassospiraceae bacterium LMO-JJ14]
MNSVREQIVSISSLLIGMSMLLIGNSLQGTLIAIRAVGESFTPHSIGVMASGYFLGFVIGTMVTAYLIERAGHIRGFTALASLASAAALGHIIIIDPIAWTVFRGISGFCFAGIYMVIESWLNERATNETRGQVLAAYMIVNLLSLTVGQFLISVADPLGYVLFCIVSILVSIAIIPVSVTRTQAPVPQKPRPLPIRRLFKISPLGFIGCLAYGLAMGAFWGLAPVFAGLVGLDVNGIAVFMSLCILGGGLMQWPMGWLSDHFDRRVVLAVACFAGGAMSFMVATGGMIKPDLLLYMAIIFGASTFPIYAVTVSHANDYVNADERVLVSGTLLLTYGAGAIVGPLLAGPIMDRLGAEGLFFYIGGVFSLVGVYALWRMTRRAAPKAEDKTDFVPTPGATPLAGELDPHAELLEESANERRDAADLLKGEINR